MNRRERKPCIYCNKDISVNNYAGHIRRAHKEKTISHNCHICKQFFSERDKLVRHIAGCAKGKKYDKTIMLLAEKKSSTTISRLMNNLNKKDGKLILSMIILEV